MYTMYMGWTFLLIYTVTLKWKKKSHLTLRAPVTILLTVPRSQVASSVYLIPDPPSYISSYDIQICDKSITGNGVREEACWWPRISPHFVHCKEQNKWSEMLYCDHLLSIWMSYLIAENKFYSTLSKEIQNYHLHVFV